MDVYLLILLLSEGLSGTGPKYLCRNEISCSRLSNSDSDRAGTGYLEGKKRKIFQLIFLTIVTGLPVFLVGQRQKQHIPSSHKSMVSFPLNPYSSARPPSPSTQKMGLWSGKDSKTVVTDKFRKGLPPLPKASTDAISLKVSKNFLTDGYHKTEFLPRKNTAFVPFLVFS